MTITTSVSAEIRAADLKPALVGLGKLVPRAPSLAVLGCVRVEATGPQGLRLTTTDLDFTLSLDLPATIGLGKGKGFAPFLLPLARLRELVTGSRADEIVTLAPSPKAPPVDEFPEIPCLRTPGLTLPESAVIGMRRAFACSSNDPTRAVLRGACRPEGKGLIWSDLAGNARSYWNLTTKGHFWDRRSDMPGRKVRTGSLYSVETTDSTGGEHVGYDGSGETI